MVTAGQVSELRPPPKFVDYVYWWGITLAVVCFILNLIVCAIRSGMMLLNSQVASVAILLLGIGITTVCVVLWIGHVAAIRPIQGRVAWLIWTTLIGSVLGTAATAYAAIWVPKHLAVDKFVLLDESQLQEDEQHHFSFKTLRARPNYDYKVEKSPNGDKDVIIAFGLLVTDFQRDGAGNFNVNGTVALFADNGELADEGELPAATNDNYVKDRSIIQKLNPAEIVQIIGSPKGKVLFVQVLRRFQPQVLDEGHKSLRIIVRDVSNNTYAEHTEHLVFR